jgi:hypothetical protein
MDGGIDGWRDAGGMLDEVGSKPCSSSSMPQRAGNTDPHTLNNLSFVY